MAKKKLNKKAKTRIFLFFIIFGSIIGSLSYSFFSNSDIKKLKDPEYVARYAREKYMYSKDGELIIRLPDDDTDK